MPRAEDLVCTACVVAGILVVHRDIVLRVSCVCVWFERRVACSLWVPIAVWHVSGLLWSCCPSLPLASGFL